MTHYIAMAGLHGCMPNFLCSCESYNDAVDVITELHQLGKKRERELRKFGDIELNLHRDGNEYAEIIECDCGTPEDHND